MKLERKAVVIVVVVILVGLVLYVPVAYLMPREWRGWATAVVLFVMGLVVFLASLSAIIERVGKWVGRREERGEQVGPPTDVDRTTLEQSCLKWARCPSDE